MTDGDAMLMEMAEKLAPDRVAQLRELLIGEIGTYDLRVGDVAARLDVSPDWVYRNRDRLGAFKVKGVLRFNWTVVLDSARKEDAAGRHERAVSRRSTRARRRATGATSSGTPLLEFV